MKLSREPKLIFEDSDNKHQRRAGGTFQDSTKNALGFILDNVRTIQFRTFTAGLNFGNATQRQISGPFNGIQEVSKVREFMNGLASKKLQSERTWRS